MHFVIFMGRVHAFCDIHGTVLKWIFICVTIIIMLDELRNHLIQNPGAID